jgi:hypothetical protein
MNQPLFIFSFKRTLVSRLIQLIGSIKYSHSAMTMPSLKYHTLESSYKNPTVIRHFSYPKGEYDIYKLKFDLSENELKKLEWFILHNISSGYDWRFLLSRALNKLIGTPITNSLERFNCDELIVAGIKYATGIDLVDSYDGLTPESLSKSKHLIKI